MRLLGFNITRTKAAPPVPVYENRGGWYPLIRESYTGAWQHNVTVDRNTVLSYPAVYSCITLIASDIAKLRVKLMQFDEDSGIWSEVSSQSPFLNVLRKPNNYQNRIQFWESWILSKLVRGNAYGLKQRDARNMVQAIYILDPSRVKPLVAEDGSVFYELLSDNMAGGNLPGVTATVPASEIIHDRMNCLFHPLVGTSPIMAAGVTATQGLAIQNNSVRFFDNMSQPGGILSAPGSIADETAARLKTAWETKFSGENAGRIAVLGDGLKFERMAMTADESQLIEQLKWTAEVICSVFHVPPYKVGVGQMPSMTSVQALNIEYYTQCLQRLIEDAEICLDEGLGIGFGVKVEGRTLGTEFDIDGLLRMDSTSQLEVLDKARSVMTLNERRKRLDLAKLPEGGSTVYLQQQDHSIEAIAARDKLLIDQSNAPKPEPVAEPPANDNAEELEAARALAEIYKGFA